jgi:hypothetical protein
MTREGLNQWSSSVMHLQYHAEMYVIRRQNKEINRKKVKKAPVHEI